MRNIYIIHGWDGSPDEPMLQWLKLNLEKQDNEVYVPEMPTPAAPMIEAWVGKLKEVINPSEDVIIVGHSIGCQAVLRYVETLSENIRIAGIVLIAPWMVLDEQTIKDEGEEVRGIAKPWMETPINFVKVKSHIGKVVAIFSNDDKYVPLNQKDLFEKRLGAETIVEHGKGHFTISDGVIELPSALNAVENI